MSDDLAMRMNALLRIFIFTLLLTIGAGFYENSRNSRYTPAQGTLTAVQSGKLSIKLDSGDMVYAPIGQREGGMWRGSIGQPVSVLRDDQIANKVYVQGFYYTYKLTICLGALALILGVVNLKLRYQLASST